MSKLNWVLSTLLVTGIVVSGLPIQSSLTATAQTNRFRAWQKIFQDFFQRQEDNPPPGTPGQGIARGDLCMIAPLSANTNTEVWSDRPLFIWQGNVGKIGVRLSGSEDILWSQAVASADNPVAYTGEPLQPGQIYQWLIFDQESDSIPKLFVPFKVMDDEERDRIRVRLIILEQELKEQGATPEETALARANYFAQKGLWSDVFQEVYSLENPPEAVEEVIQRIPDQLCM
ncbi:MULTISPECIES: hypothetical protein [unclassified Coleofasciculus]|uniref:hypothetical protein n=1 Tax=unclassified Coleofasciculus TaxID=2692782 RepID=UPI001880F6C0|nr:MULTISPECIES: hypothetical protein [unclassified Coleofasciculus]MBE9128375.1 hypothetical protein [Coleofasciculus sp. LEGE 07081]MBE9151431.1 hypothetical protein [Coleofasciculus sp. LEGE 07092]